MDKPKFDHVDHLCIFWGGVFNCVFSPTLVFAPVLFVNKRKHKDKCRQQFQKSLLNLRCTYFELGNLLKAINFITSIFSLGLNKGSKKTFNH